jgi:hypothetical protein
MEDNIESKKEEKKNLKNMPKFPTHSSKHQRKSNVTQI